MALEEKQKVESQLAETQNEGIKLENKLSELDDAQELTKNLGSSEQKINQINETLKADRETLSQELVDAWRGILQPVLTKYKQKYEDEYHELKLKEQSIQERNNTIQKLRDSVSNHTCELCGQSLDNAVLTKLNELLKEQEQETETEAEELDHTRMLNIQDKYTYLQDFDMKEGVMDRISQLEDRIAKIEFVPVDDNGAPIAYNPSNVARIDTVKVTQTSAEPIVENTRQGDSTSLVAISRALNEWSGGWDTTQPMEMWSGVILWENTGDRQKDGRVRYVRFYMFNTEDGLPYQVRYLTAAEEIVFYSNENNTMRKDIDLGEDICQLGQLKRLTISAYGLDDNSIPESFYTSFPDLEYLNLSSNNFTAIPEGINPVNFPKLHAFMMSNNQRYLVYDTQNAAVNNDEQFAEKYAGLFNENKNPENADAGGGLPLRFLRWEKLDTLQLSLNYLQGELPTDSYLLSHNFEPWTADYKLIDEEGEEILNVADSLKGGNPEFFQTRSIPRVLPRLKSLAINLNRFTGALPNWILYHPNLDLWDPYTLLFNQEGRDREGTTAGFSGTPSNLNYYYDVYGNKKNDPDNAPSDE